jgi:predicted acylesterase/phospholipase RssA
LLLSLIGLNLLQGCAVTTRNELPPWVSARSPAAAPMRIRTLGADQEFIELAAATVARSLPDDHTGEPLHVLALSGGGAGGAFGAGALVGMTESGQRPQFDVVTGVSAGALIAPYAFLGPAWDKYLAESYTSGSGDHVLRLRGLGAIFGSSVYRGGPLTKLIDHYVTDDLIRAVAGEAAKGRLLLVATTNVDSGAPVIWDLGSIAMHGGTNARVMFRDVLVASASVPGMFPPVVMHFRKNGQVYDEAHVDGSVTLPFFVAPEFADDSLESPTTPTAATRRPTTVYVLIDGPLDERPQATRLQTGAILSRSVTASLHVMMRTTLELVASNAAANGVSLQYSAIPAAFPRRNAFDFSAAGMRPLFQYAAQCGAETHLWTTFHRGVPANTEATAVSAGGSVPCPADDALIEYFAKMGAP